MRRWLLLPVVLGLSCARAYHGEPENLKDVTVPDIVRQEQKAPVPPLNSPAPVRQTLPVWRAYIPPKVAPNGDTVEGHYLIIAPTAPPVEAMPPAKILPRAPLVQYQTPAVPPPQGQTPPPMQGPVRPAAPQGGLPQQPSFWQGPFGTGRIPGTGPLLPGVPVLPIPTPGVE